MGENRLRILACENFRQELDSVLGEEEFADVALSTFPPDCSKPSRRDPEELKELIHSFLEEDGTVMVLIGSCLADKAFLEEEGNRVRCLRLENCFQLVAADPILEALLSEGAYLTTPGWLRKWPLHMQLWGFDRDSARAYFQESIRKIILLDTGIDGNSAMRLESLADFLALPFQIMPVGLDYLRLKLKSLVLEWRLERERKKGMEMLARANRRSADYEMSFDLLSSMAEVLTEDDVVGAIFDLFGMLFAPESQFYSSFHREMPGRIWSRPAGIGDLEINVARLAIPRGQYEFTGSGKGFRISIPHQGERIGVLEIEGIAFPQYIEEYLNLALSIVRVCGLAIANARQFEELISANAELEAFAHTASHDLKGPLVNVSFGSNMLTDMIEEVDLEEKKAELVEIAGLIGKSAEKSTQLVDSLLELARVGRDAQDVSNVDVARVIEDIIREKSMVIAEKRARITIGDGLGQLVANETQIYQLFANLIDNAIRYADGDDPRVEVSRIGDDHGRGRRYVVRDNGPGIAEEDLENIFMPFFKGEGGRTGVGLAIVDKIIKAYGGEIVAYNDGGGCFEFTLRNVVGGHREP